MDVYCASLPNDYFDVAYGLLKYDASEQACVCM
jgi:hypothetical protein